MTVKLWIHMLMLGICSIEDLREKKISVWKIRLYGGCVLFYEVWYLIGKQQDFLEWVVWSVAGLLPGVFMLLISKCSKETIGYGDGYITLILGFSIGFWKILGILGTAFLGTFLLAIYMVFMRKRSKNTEIAFVPFLFFGMMGMSLWKGN